MKREIKFRGKCSRQSKYAGQWVYGNLVVPEEIQGDEVMIVKALSDDASCTYHVDVNSVGQFTGLTDKNGREIYEGDILQSAKYKDIKHIVVYDEHYASFMALHIDGNMETPLESKCHITQKWIYDYPKEVIGNVIDNKDLLDE